MGKRLLLNLQFLVARDRLSTEVPPQKIPLTPTPSLRRASFAEVATKAESGFAQAGLPTGAREFSHSPLKKFPTVSLLAMGGLSNLALQRGLTIIILI